MYTVSFNTGEGGSYIEPQNVQEDSLVSPVANPTKPGHTFTNWDYDFQLPVKRDFVINAIWSVNSYTITYNPDGGIIEGELTQSVNYGESYVLEKVNKSGYTFLGWYYNETQIKDGIWNFETDITLVAKWSANTYQITFNYDGGEEKNQQCLLYLIAKLRYLKQAKPVIHF